MYQINIDITRCKGCGLCADYCPTNVYDYNIGMEPIPSRESNCIGCMRCEEICPDFAISIERLEENGQREN